MEEIFIEGNIIIWGLLPPLHHLLNPSLEHLVTLREMALCKEFAYVALRYPEVLLSILDRQEREMKKTLEEFFFRCVR